MISLFKIVSHQSRNNIMFSKKEKQRIIATLGKHYSGKIIPVLTKKGILNDKGEPFSAPAIRLFVGGQRENNTVEVEILRLVAKTERKAKKQAELRKQLTAKK